MDANREALDRQALQYTSVRIFIIEEEKGFRITYTKPTTSTPVPTERSSPVESFMTIRMGINLT